MTCEIAYNCFHLSQLREDQWFKIIKTSSAFQWATEDGKTSTFRGSSGSSFGFPILCFAQHHQWLCSSRQVVICPDSELLSAWFVGDTSVRNGGSMLHWADNLFHQLILDCKDGWREWFSTSAYQDRNGDIDYGTSLRHKSWSSVIQCDGQKKLIGCRRSRYFSWIPGLARWFCSTSWFSCCLQWPIPTSSCKLACSGQGKFSINILKMQRSKK